jgi:hypothetical protein
VTANQIKIRQGAKIGSVGAETDDEFLFKCFIDHPAFTEIKDLNNSKMFLLGSTGIGKTAFLRMIERQEKDAIFLELTDMAMSHLSNSNAISFLQKIGVDLSFFFQSLWRHVICVEFIKMAIRFDQTEKKANLIQRITGWKTNNDRLRKELEKFVEDYQGDFWNTTDKTITIITEKLEKDLHVEFGGEISRAAGKINYGRAIGAEKRSEYSERAQKYVNSELLVRLSHVISAIADFVKDDGRKYYVLIDKIDEHWVDPSLKHVLVHSLFEACKGLRKIRSLKVITAIRNDVYEKMNHDFPPSTIQVEKNEDYITRIRWGKDLLFKLVQSRVNHLFRWQYTSENVFFYDIFKESYDNKEKTWNYMVERSLHRPRDLVKFVNYCLETSETKSSVSKNDFASAEGLYSADRKEALIHEWEPYYQSADFLINVLHQRPPTFLLAEMCSSDTVDLVFDKLGAETSTQQDELFKIVASSIDGGPALEPIVIAREIASRLYLMGAVGLKISADTPWNWVHLTQRAIKGTLLSAETRLEVHPMLWRALSNVKRKEHQR